MIRRKPGRFPWVLAGSAASVVLFAGALVLRLPVAPRKATRPHVPALTLMEAGVVSDGPLDEQGYLMNPTPLFLPSELSSAQLLPPPEDQAGAAAAAGEFPPHLVFPTQELAITVPGRARPLETAVEALATQPTLHPLQGFGRRDQPETALPARLAMVETYDAADGKLIERVAVAAPPDLQVARLPSIWAPVEMLVRIGRDGSAAPPTVTVGSGSAEVDKFFKNYLENTHRIGQRLRPGFYRLQVGP